LLNEQSLFIIPDYKISQFHSLSFSKLFIHSCGCTVPDYPRYPVAPGKEGVISVVFNSAGKSGIQDKVITLTSNAATSTTELHLTGEVK